MDFFNDIFHNLALLEFYFLNIIYILLYIEFILSTFFRHSNILTRASHHWCLASNIVLVHHCNVDPTPVCFLFISVVWTECFHSTKYATTFLMFLCLFRHICDLNDKMQSLKSYGGSHALWYIYIYTCIYTYMSLNLIISLIIGLYYIHNQTTTI